MVDVIFDRLRKIVSEAGRLAKDFIPSEILEGMEVNYACIFCQSEDELKERENEMSGIGKIVLETKTGNVWKIPPLETEHGSLQIVKIRKPDPAKTEEGDADFTLRDWDVLLEFSKGRKEFRLIEREKFRMIELRAGRNVIAYFSNPPMPEVYGLV